MTPEPSAFETLAGAPGIAAITVHSTMASASEVLGRSCWSLVLLDSGFADGAAMELLPRLAECSRAAIVLVARHPSMTLALQALQAGARDVLSFPPDARQVAARMRGPCPEPGRVLPLEEQGGEEDLIGRSAAILEVFRAVSRVARSDATVLLTGESGTGKELVARAIRRDSRRSAAPFVAVNCAAIPEALLESELFGHEKGAFTGAIALRRGRFERAGGGTLFLDEIGDMPMVLQSKILRALQEREIERVGGERPIPVDVRVIAASNRDLAEAVREGTFREDLFYRLAVVRIGLPPLRERPEDLPLLARHFGALWGKVHERGVQHIAQDALDRLAAYAWPGNVRELKNAMERAVLMADGPTLLASHLPDEIRVLAHGSAQPPAPGPTATLEEVEAAHIRRVLLDSGGNLSRAAETLGVHRNTLRRKVRRYGVGHPGQPPPEGDALQP